MKKTSATTTPSGNKPLIFFGNERLATGVSTTAPVLRALIENGYSIAAVVSNYESATSRSSRELEVASIAHTYHIPVLLPGKPTEIADQLASYGAEMGILIAYGRIVPQSIIDLFPKGIVNIHPSLLPLHRGPTPLESVLLAGETKTGVSIMALAKEMDAGPVYGQAEVNLKGNESKQALADLLSETGKSMLLELLPGILEGSIVALPQDESRATYDSLLKKDDGVIDWRKPAQVLDREIRAYLNWPKSRTMIAGKEVVITKAHATNHSSEAGKITAEHSILNVGCGEGSLVIEHLKPAGKQEMTGADFIRGYGSKLR